MLRLRAWRIDCPAHLMRNHPQAAIAMWLGSLLPQPPITSGWDKPCALLTARFHNTSRLGHRLLLAESLRRSAIARVCGDPIGLYLRPYARYGCPMSNDHAFTGYTQELLFMPGIGLHSLMGRTRQVQILSVALTIPN